MKVVVLTGAGISAESGVATFRDANGLWEGHRIEDVASPEGFRRNPAMVHEFYNRRRAQLSEVEPNEAHRALARLQQCWGDDVALITQNVDDLHERAGSSAVLHMHGQLLRGKCTDCDKSFPWSGEMSVDSVCPRCERTGAVRPDIVWFGEMPYQMERIERLLLDCEHFIAIGTSGVVYPAAGLVSWAKQLGAKTTEINLQASANAHQFDEQITGPAGREVPRWVESLLG